VNLYTQSNGKVKIGKNEVEINQVSHYPWDGNIRLTLNPTVKGKFTVKLRIPGWAENEPVPTDLYKFTQQADKGYEVFVNGRKLKVSKDKGYVAIHRMWKKGDIVELNLPMPVRRIQANEKVMDDCGKLAIQRGPVVYCIEGTDQGDKHVFNKYIPENISINFTYQKDLLNGVVTLNGTAREIDRDVDGRQVEKDVPFIAIPYSTWNNRGAGEMAVWIPSRASYAKATPEPTIASRATSVNAFGVNDQWEPKSSGDISKPYFYWWGKSGSEESVEYAFSQPETVSNVEVYWLDFDQYDGNFRVPESWKLFYKEGKEWKEVEPRGNYTTMKDTYNSLDFTTVKTKGLKIVARLKKGESGGVIEWKVR
jgi:hypothetical protein